jgi:hypothetical protein
LRKTLNPDPKTLRSDPAYQLIKELKFQDIVPFVLEQIRKKTLFPVLYFTVNLGMLAFILILSAKGLADQSLAWKKLFIQAGTGILAGSILVIPFHELLHGLAYRILGARKIIFGADLSQLIFYVTARHYTVSGMQIHLLTLAPFIIINLLTVIATALIFQDGLLFSAFFLLSHNIMCIGDFAISGYVNRTVGRVYTYDEPERKLSYFYQKT